MNRTSAPGFDAIADADTKRAFVGGRPEAVEWLPPATKLFKWTQSITGPRGISPWWQLLESRRLANGSECPGIRELQFYAGRVQVNDRDYARARLAVSEQWNRMTNAVAIELVNGAWGYIGKAAGQLENRDISNVFLIGGAYQVWIPGLVATDIRRISILPHLATNKRFGAGL